VYASSLSIESDTELLARRAYADGARTLATVASDAPLQRRFKAAFSAAWQRTGGSTTRDYRFDAQPEVLTVLRRELVARPADATLLALNADEAPLAKCFAAGTRVREQPDRDGLPPPMLRDLEGVRYVEIPWLADPAGAILPACRTSLGDPVLDRLYALGSMHSRSPSHSPIRFLRSRRVRGRDRAPCSCPRTSLPAKARSW
jgi:outer membrane PBP1 activator LpoA protein